jgi:hypothetical protein
MAMLAFLLVPNLWQAEVKFLPDHIGNAVVRLRTDFYDQYRLPDKEMQEYRGKLQRIADWVVAQPALSPTRGFSMRGWVMVTRSGSCPRTGPCLNAPVAALASLPVFNWSLDPSTNKASTENEYSELVSLWVNDPWAKIKIDYALHGDSGNESERKDKGFDLDEKGNVQFFIEPRHSADIDGCPLYEDVNGNRQFLVVTKISRPLFLPLTREVYLRSIIRWFENQLKNSEDSLEKSSAAGTYRKWIAGSKERARVRQQTYESLKSNPQKAEALRNQMEATEQKVTADFRQAMEKEQAEQAQGIGPLSQNEKNFAWMQNVVSQLQTKLAAMTARERSAQARYSNKTQFWESIDSPDGAPLVVCNPDFLDRSLPRSAIQAIVAEFYYDRGIERGEKIFYGAAAAGEATHLGVWRMKKESRWSALKELMAEPRR